MGDRRPDEAQIDTAQLNLGYADIRSPIDGRLGARLVDIGNMVHATDAPAPWSPITQIKPIFVSFTVPQDVADEIRRNQATAPLAVLAYASDDKTLLASGKLTLIDNAIDQTTGTIRLKATFDNDDERLWPGEFVNVRLVISTAQGRRHGAGADRAGRAERPLRLCHQARQHGRAPRRRGRRRCRTASPSSTRGSPPARRSSSTASTG